MPNYRIEFYEVSLTPTASAPSPTASLSTLVGSTTPQLFHDSGITRELFDLERRPGRITGSLRKFRTHDLPEIGAPGVAAHEIDLDDNQGLIEKNFWALYEADSILLWHANGNANTAKQFERTLTHLLGTRVHITPLVRRDALHRLLEGTLILRSLEVSIPRPRHSDFFPEEEWNRNIMNAMSAAEGDRIKVTITSDSRITDHARLSDRMKRALEELVTDRAASTVKVNVEENGLIHPVDLLADRIFSTQMIEHDGRYPGRESMYGAFDEALNEERAEITAILGEGGTRLR